MVSFYFRRHVKEIKKVKDDYVLLTEEGDEIKTNYVLIAVGRKANVDGMNLEGIGVKASARGIVVDPHMRTSVKNIYASGDVVDKRIPKLTPTAEFESNYIAIDILNPFNGKIHYPVVPNLVFTLPRIASVGVSSKEALARPKKYRVEKVALGETMSWLNKNQRSEHLTYIIDKKKRVLLGAEVFSDDAGVYIDFLTLLINLKVGARKLSKMIFAFPT